MDVRTEEIMEFENRLADYWHSFWNARFAKVPLTNDDLMRQTANTINKVPLPIERIQQRAGGIAKVLQLRAADELVDFCCGNGLVDFELAPYVNSITGIDFAENLIAAAQHLKQRPNIRYCLGDVTEPLSSLIGEVNMANKFLMAGSLGYLQPGELDRILHNIVRHLQGREFQFLIVAVPNLATMANFYNTPERLARHLKNEKTLPNVNDGIGRWWRAEEIEGICLRYGLTAQITDPSLDGTNYRMDALISNRAE